MRIEQITFTRFIAAISIVIYHYGRNIFPFNSDLISFIIQQADIAVSYFFILSGFVMMIAYGNKASINPMEYLKNRLARIYPVYLSAILLLLLWVVIENTLIDYTGLFLNLFLIQAWVPGKALSFNYPGWSLSVEFFFYMLFPFLFNYIYTKKSFKALLFPVILIWIISQIALHLMSKSDFNDGTSIHFDLMYYLPIMHLNEFLIGNLAGLVFLKFLIDRKGNYDFLIVLLILILVNVLKYPLGLDFHNGLLALLVIPIIILLSLNNGIITSILKNRFVVFLGEISFGIYILQHPIFKWSTRLFQYFNIDNYAICFYIYLIILIGISSISFLAFETPLRRVIKKLHYRQSENIEG